LRGRGDDARLGAMIPVMSAGREETRDRRGDDAPGAGAATIKDVARAAGVSPTTVSHVYSGNRHVASDTKERVRAAALRLGYSPNSRALGLVTRRSMTIGLSAPVEPGDFVLNRFFAAMLSVFSRVAMGEGYSFVFLPADDREAAERLVALANEGRFDGVIVLDPAAGGALGTALDEVRVPVVSVGRRLDAPDEPFVDVEHGSAMDIALDHLRAQGYAAPALLTIAGGFAHVHDRRAAYERWCAAHGATPRVLSADQPTEAAGFAAVMGATGVPFDAVLCAQGALAFGALRALRELGRAVPAEVGVVGSTEGETATSSDPPLTTVESRPEAIGEVAITALLALMAGREIDLPQEIEPHLIARGSTARCAPGS
jgi:DNA-binding LacI/PurR family transcriptional regulator